MEQCSIQLVRLFFRTVSKRQVNTQKDETENVHITSHCAVFA